VKDELLAFIKDLSTIVTHCVEEIMKFIMAVVEVEVELIRVYKNSGLSMV
jgi:hypothetical protein